MADSTAPAVTQEVRVDSPIPGVPYITLLFGAAGLLELCLGQCGAHVNSFAAKASDYGGEEAATLLRAYFSDPHIPIPPIQPPGGTPYQRRVWGMLQQIPPGEVRTYGELAQTLGSSPRAVAAACRANPIALLIPCHRVVARDGLGGYMGKTDGRELAIKRWLLQHEGYV